MRALSLIWLAPLLLAGGCLKFQQVPTSQWGTKNFVEIAAGEKLYVLDSGGKGPVLLMVHGFGASHTSWSAIRPALEKSYRVIAVDLPGHGYSDKYAGDYSLKAVAHKLLRLLDLKGIKRAHLAAHSWGTALALNLALQAPGRVRSLTLMAPFAYEKQLPPFLTWARAPLMGEFLFSMIWDQRLDDRLAYAFYDADRFATPEVTDKAKAVMKRPGVLAAALSAARGISFIDMEPRYPELKMPVLIISGREDRVTRLPAARRLNADLPNARHKVLPLCGHMIPVEHPAKVLRAIRKFHAEINGMGQAPPLRPPRPGPRTPVPTPARPAPTKHVGEGLVPSREKPAEENK